MINELYEIFTKISNKNLGNWLSTQKQNYRKQIYSMNNEIIYDTWTEFINKYDELSR